MLQYSLLSDCLLTSFAVCLESLSGTVVTSAARMETSHVDDDFTHRNMQYINSASNHAMIPSRGVETTSPMTSQRHILQTSERDALNREMAFNIKM